MIDLHCHLLPGIDDGPADVEGSVALASRAAEDGVRKIAATPHIRDDFPMVLPDELGERCKELQGRLDDESVPLEVVPGGEIDALRIVGADAEQLRLVSYGQQGTDVLLETPYEPLTPTFGSVVSQLQRDGYRVLLAHPERNPTLRESGERLRELVRRGALVQVTATSLVNSARSSRSAQTAQALVKEGLAHVIASDSHGVDAYGRATLRDGLEAARALVGTRADWMVRDAPAAILAGDPLPDAPPGDARRPGVVRRFLSRGGE